MIANNYEKDLITLIGTHKGITDLQFAMGFSKLSETISLVDEP